MDKQLNKKELNKEELDRIKKLYGEKFAKLCRDLFPTILEHKGVLLNVLENYFEPNRFLYNDIIEQGQKYTFQSYIYEIVNKDNNIQINYEDEEVNQTPEELLNLAGYDLFRCETNEDVLSFKKYYALGEEICTFNDKDRINTHNIFFAVKKNIDDIKRENFEVPKREDKYGTSVISIQFNKRNNILSIKNRYNHNVINPDATFSNNLDNIINGLSKSFNKYYGLENKEPQKFKLEGYVFDETGKYYPYNVEIFNNYYCPNNIIIKDGKAQRLDKGRYEVFDGFVLDKQKNEIASCLGLDDPFTDEFNDVKKIEILKNKETNNINFNILKENGKEFQFVLDKHNRIIEYKNDYIEELNDHFLFKSDVYSFIAPNVKKVGNWCLERSKNLRNLNLENVEEIGCEFGFYNLNLSKLSLPNLKKVDAHFLFNNRCVEELLLPNVETICFNFLSNNRMIKKVELPKVKEIGSDFLKFNERLTSISLPNVKEISDGFMRINEIIETVNIPKIESIGSYFLEKNKKITEIIMPNVRNIDNKFLYNNEKINKLEIPNIETIGDYFLTVSDLKTLNMPKLKKVGDVFMGYNNEITELYLPNLIQVGSEFLFKNDNLKKVDLPNLRWNGSYFLDSYKHKDQILQQVLENRLNYKEREC